MAEINNVSRKINYSRGNLEFIYSLASINLQVIFAHVVSTLMNF